MWHDYMDSAHAILPLMLPVQRRQAHALFHSSAVMAAALESSTLPYRLSSVDSSSSSAPSSRIGMKSFSYGDYTGDSSFGAVARMSFSNFLTNLQPAPGRSVLELDALLPITSLPETTLWPRLFEGTSLERDQRMKYQPQATGTRRPRDVLPGLWMMGTSHGGILSSLSPNRSGDRSNHTHFALSSSFRHKSSSASEASATYVDCLIEGMGIRYRPEQSFATHVNQSMNGLTSGGYGAGSYWKHAWGPEAVLSVLGNSTRFFSQASEIGTGVKQVLSRQDRGFLNRDVANEILPEEDNCHEVLSTIYNIRDRYQPPRGSGCIEEDDDDNHLFMD